VLTTISKAVGAYTGAAKIGGRWRSVRCTQCFSLRYPDQKRVPFTKAAWDCYLRASRTGHWDFKCEGAGAHREWWQRKSGTMTGREAGEERT